MKQYLSLLLDVANNGEWEENRTGIRTLSLNGAMRKYNLREGFPAVTTKKLAFKQVVGELLAFLKGTTDIREFHKLGCTVWDENLNSEYWIPKRQDENDLGLIYGKMWREFNYVDQIQKLLNDIATNPTSRQMVVSAWDPASIGDVCLPPCHVMFHVLIRQDTYLDLIFYQRSCDLFLGVPFNIASYALLAHILAQHTGYEVGELTHFMGSYHIYENHLSQVDTQLRRVPYDLPTLTIKQFRTLDDLTPDMFELIGYESYPAISAPMAV